MVTSRYGAPQLPTGQRVSETTVNEIVEWIEKGAGFFPCKQVGLNGPPAVVAGEVYVVGAAPTGAWGTAAAANKIAIALNGAWVYVAPYEGFVAYDQNADRYFIREAAAWTQLDADAAAARLGTANNRFLTPAAIFAAAAAVALTSSASITPNGNNGWNFELTLAHSGQLENPTNFKDGQSGVIKITQDGTGNRTWTYGSNWKFPGGAPVLSTAAGAIDLLAYHVWPGGIITATLSKAYSS